MRLIYMLAMLLASVVSHADVPTTTLTPTDTPTPAPVLSSPAGFQVSSQDGGDVVLGWNFVPEASSYNVFQDDVQIGTSGKTSFDVGGLNKGQTYAFGVQSVDDSGNVSDISASVTVTVGSALVPSVVSRSLFNQYALQGKSFFVSVPSTSALVPAKFTILSLVNPANSKINMIVGNFNVGSLNSGEMIPIVGNQTALTGMTVYAPVNSNTNFSSTQSAMTVTIDKDGLSSAVTEGVTVDDVFFSNGQPVFPDLKEVFILGPGSRVDFQIIMGGGSQRVSLFMEWAEIPQ